jgi:methylmalonyl-CoA/ethylmalonyl-CoA epimerase
MKIKRIEHIGVVVRDLEGSRALWEDCLGIRRDYVEDMPNYSLRLAMLPVGDTMVELLAGTTPESKFGRMVAEGKEGLNHICFEVEDIDSALDELRAKGVALLDQVARPGHAGSRIAFLDPAGTGNVLIELAQLPQPPGQG